MSKSDEIEISESLPVELVKRLISLSLIFGLVGGAGGGYLWQRYGSNVSGPAPAKRQLVQENSATIDVVKKVSPSVVSITSQTTGIGIFGLKQTATGAGTGMIVTEDGLILTNKHVVADAQTFSVFTSDGKEYKNAKLVAVDPTNDIAFLKITAKGLKPVEIGDSSGVVVGQRVIAIGNALGQFQNTATEGIISGVGRPIVAGDTMQGTEQLQDLLQTDAAINPGNSGGPLVDIEGKVIGMNTAVAGGGAQNIGFAIPMKEIEPVLKSVKSSGKVVRPYLGVRYLPVTKEFAARNGLKVTDGAYVSGGSQDLAVVPDSPAAKAGIKEGDIITKIGSDKIDASHSLSLLIGKHAVGDKIPLTIIRDGKEQTVDITLEEAPSAQ